MTPIRRAGVFFGCSVVLLLGLALVVDRCFPLNAAPVIPAVRLPKSPDSERICGVWVIEKLTQNGKKTDEDHPWIGRKIRFFEDGSFEYDLFAGSRRYVREYQLVPERSHGLLDFRFRRGPKSQRDDEEHHLLAIYKFQDDRLRITIGVVDFPTRPSSFELDPDGLPFMHLVLSKVIGPIH